MYATSEVGEAYITLLVDMLLVSIRQHTSAYVSIRQHTGRHATRKSYAAFGHATLVACL
jgi:hypothetical protein